MDILWIILANLLSAGAVFATAFFILKQFFAQEQNKRIAEQKISNQKQLIPVRLQAYERMVLFLERIAPNSIILRVYRPGMNTFQFQSALISNIREEFEHNLAQQVYISPSAWELVRHAKEETIKMVNIAASRLDDQAAGAELSKQIIELSMQAKEPPGAKAIAFVKNEVGQIF